MTPQWHHNLLFGCYDTSHCLIRVMSSEHYDTTMASQLAVWLL